MKPLRTASLVSCFLVGLLSVHLGSWIESRISFEPDETIAPVTMNLCVADYGDMEEIKRLFRTGCQAVTYRNAVTFTMSRNSPGQIQFYNMAKPVSHRWGADEIIENYSYIDRGLPARNDGKYWSWATRR